jgi:hypothetical protein
MRSAIYDPIFSSIPLPLLSSVAHCSLLLLLLLFFLSLLTYLLTPSLQTPHSLSLSLSPFFTLAAAFSGFLPHPACWFVVVVVVVVVGGGGGTPCLVPHNTTNKQTNKQQAQSPFHLLPLDSRLIQFVE